MALLKLACLAVFIFVTTAFEIKQIENIPKIDEHNIAFCADEDPTDWKILHRETVSAKPKFLQIAEKTITYPLGGIGKATLTCIRVTDKVANGHGGYPSILEGGIGFNYVTIRFTSQRSRGFEFFVEIWGK